MSELFYEDFTVGRKFRTGGVTLTETQIIDFGLTFDPQPFHTDVVAAERSAYGGLIASGFQTVALLFRMFIQTGAIAASSMGSSGLDEVRWYLPVRPGDTLRAVIEVIERRPSRSRTDSGLVRLLYTGFNQHGEPALSFIANHLIAKRNQTIAV